ncbi:MAG: nucleoside monophosphate kinase [Candidatus Paceibacterota bacterium]
MINKPQTFIFYGIAGSGKGTQVKLLQNVLKAKDGMDTVYGAPGNEFRKLVESGNLTGSTLKDAMEAGLLLPDFLPNTVFADILISELTTDKHLIADGFPRTVVQSENFEEMMKFYNRENIKVIYIELSKEEAIKRMKIRARPDDTDEGIAKRFDEYVKNIIPSMNYFKDKENYKMYMINGEQSIEDVHKEIITKLNLI